MKTLFTWFGQADVDGMNQDTDSPISNIALKHPEPFDQIVIISNKWEEERRNYVPWLEKKLAIAQRPFQVVQGHTVSITSPIDYVSISKQSQKWINKLSSESDELYINLTSGSPAMSAVSIILGKGKTNTYFYQSNRQREIFLDDIPFDFVAEHDASVARAISSKATKLPTNNKAFEDIIAVSPPMLEVVNKASKLAPLDLPVLVLGETGTGKEVISNAIHKASSRASQPMKTVNCGALPQNLVDSILFGHVKGAFTGAVKEHKGVFEQADGGTLFLDEVGELSLDVQVKLLRALQQGEITRVGDDKTITVDVRVIAATHRNLVGMVECGEFREDLFYRLALGVIEIPPLRNRVEDIEPLVNALAKEINDNAQKHQNYKSKIISNKGMKFTLSQPWRGNIRELWSTLNRALLLSDNDEIFDLDIQNALINRENKQQDHDIHLAYGDVVNLKQIIENIEKKYVEAALKATGNGRVKSAEMLSLGNHQNLRNMMKRLKMISENEPEK
ncbi:sigma-54 interaction domain-containing protein [Thalassotalea sp. PS06]|uniref:sigma-54 interaction domain-containing protein n=1 Tax=Thalassotalea sp. PS06 TaxID=2594005 RepID=UPI001163A9D8|nr:sigma-54 dependent transcriptional regulator [Thalassotalea sp. PS06]QDP01353.1 sigma-54-dependent Fis family transcriptional regulator [Thalassotalea sp. PS06]